MGARKEREGGREGGKLYPQRGHSYDSGGSINLISLSEAQFGKL